MFKIRVHGISQDHEEGSREAWHDLAERLAQAESCAATAEKELRFQVSLWKHSCSLSHIFSSPWSRTEP